MGAVASIADTAFEALTGKDIGDTVLALFTGHHSNATVAGNAAQPTPPQQPPPDVGLTALTVSLSQKGIDSDTAQRALMAYRKSMALPGLMLAAAP